METRILVVEDEQIVAMDIQASLEGLGYAVPFVVGTGEEAICCAEQSRPDLVLMDIRLAGEMDGIETAGVIQARFELPFVYLTAQMDDDTVERAMATGPFAYVLKPFETRMLHTTIQLALAKHQAEMRLKEKERELQRLNRELESRVRMRTAELARSNAELAL